MRQKKILKASIRRGNAVIAAMTLTGIAFSAGPAMAAGAAAVAAANTTTVAATQ